MKSMIVDKYKITLVKQDNLFVITVIKAKIVMAEHWFRSEKEANLYYLGYLK